MGVLRHWSDEKVAQVAERLGTPTPARRDDVRRVLNEADAVPRDLYQGAVQERDEAVELLRKAAHRLVPLPPYQEIRDWLDSYAGGQYERI